MSAAAKARNAARKAGNATSAAAKTKGKGKGRSK